MRRPSAQDEATTWCARLSQPSIGADDIHAFFAWRRKPANRAAFDAAAKARRRQTDRYLVEPDPFGFSVIDVRTGQPAEFATRAQAGISEADAEVIAEVLNRRALTDRATPTH
jgi:DNA-directed RNA polymerase specialized sigma24 family protein